MAVAIEADRLGPARRGRRVLAVLVGAGVLVALGVVVALPLVRPAPADAGVVRPVALAQPAPTPAPTAQPAQAGLPFTVYTARDPFEQLVELPDAGTGGVGTDAGTAAGTTASPGGGTTVITPTEAATGPGTATTTPSPGSTAAGSGGTRIELVDVFTGSAGDTQAVVTVNGTGYTVAVGQTFADAITMASAEGACAVFTVDGGPVALCEGDTVRK